MTPWDDVFLPGLPIEKILGAYAKSPGNEIEKGKLLSKESSAALAANTFGPFLDRAGDFPALADLHGCGWPASNVWLKAEVRFPWRGGLHPWLDVLIETPTHLIGIESKRYEPFRGNKAGEFSDAYMRPVWGGDMRAFEQLRDALIAGSISFHHFDACQLVKHAFGFRTQAAKRNKAPVLLYLYAEPASWPEPDGRPISVDDRRKHAEEVNAFAFMVDGDEVRFSSCTYRQLLAAFTASLIPSVRAHADALADKFDI